MKALARRVRVENGLQTPRVLPSDIRRIYRAYGIKIDLRSGFRQLRGAYFGDDLGPTVVIAKGLPPDPKVFTMGHELKHHLVDRDLPGFKCDLRNETDPIEIGAEVFAAELILPEKDFADALRSMGVDPGTCTAEHIVRLKYETRTTLSYAGLAKRAERMHFAQAGTLQKVQFKKLEQQIYGMPFRRPRRSP
jgi:Zn-dependent peptidase ImmA (M78 family)